MNNLLKQLSPAAQTYLDGYKNCNIAIVNANVKIPEFLKKHLICSIGIFDKNDIFLDIVPGSSLIKANQDQPVPKSLFYVFSYHNYSLFGEIRKVTNDFLLKRFDSDEFQFFGKVKYSFNGLVVKLLEPYSFKHGGGRKL